MFAPPNSHRRVSAPDELQGVQPRFEANFVSSFSVPNTKSLFSFITLRKKWFPAANFDRNSDTGKIVGLISLPSVLCAAPRAETTSLKDASPKTIRSTSDRKSVV